MKYTSNILSTRSDMHIDIQFIFTELILNSFPLVHKFHDKLNMCHKFYREILVVISVWWVVCLLCICTQTDANLKECLQSFAEILMTLLKVYKEPIFPSLPFHFPSFCVWIYMYIIYISHTNSNTMPSILLQYYYSVKFLLDDDGESLLNGCNNI